MKKIINTKLFKLFMIFMIKKNIYILCKNNICFCNFILNFKLPILVVYCFKLYIFGKTIKTSKFFYLFVIMP